jgi:hypothetical protein
VSQVFGSRVLPPPGELPGPVSDAVTAWREASERATKARVNLGRARREDLPAAKRRDVEQAADALEAGRREPGPTNERKALDRIAGLERQASAAELVARRADARMVERIEEHAEEIGKLADERLAAARSDYLAAVGDLEASIGRLVEAVALRTWAADPQASWKVRGLRPVPIMQHSSDGASVDSVIAGLREVIEPPKRKPIPSPFSVPAPEPEVPAPVEPAPAPGS